ncbi:MAG: hypothetical protein MZV63_46275 [Marinilabiliales bacterium]|nr:hypothetical protein [Marinilabiliales bacterium]
MQFNGDLSQNLLWNFKSSKNAQYGYAGSGYNYGLAITEAVYKGDRPQASYCARATAERDRR